MPFKTLINGDLKKKSAECARHGSALKKTGVLTNAPKINYYQMSHVPKL